MHFHFRYASFTTTCKACRFTSYARMYEDDHFAVDETELFDLLPDADDAHADNDGSVSE